MALPEEQRMELAERLNLLQRLDLFESLNEEDRHFVAGLVEIELKCGDFLFKDGDPAQDMFVLMAGKLEIQKLAYFLQEAGEQLRLRYNAAHYGPYAPNLNKVLERIEGHFTRGYGDSPKPNTEIDLLPGGDLLANLHRDL